ncbi:hypothetical protein GCM10011499_27590 [Pelagibacterium lentulum]|uniref:Uncharacterized protein n=2 Tax=Pelagibacterium lentulum TaxID=2029865 RepID=A0A916RFM4_9HYPH|nr:hypothetical protein GCM10011499_27590 [Pelagibacterium lentulum]
MRIPDIAELVVLEMTDLTVEHTPWSLADHMRMPRFNADDVRSPLQAFVHALPAFLYISINVWLAGIGGAWALALVFPFPLAIELGFAAILAVPCAIVSWMVFVTCVEVEAVTPN